MQSSWCKCNQTDLEATWKISWRKRSDEVSGESKFFQINILQQTSVQIRNLNVARAHINRNTVTTSPGHILITFLNEIMINIKNKARESYM